MLQAWGIYGSLHIQLKCLQGLCGISILIGCFFQTGSDLVVFTITTEVPTENIGFPNLWLYGCVVIFVRQWLANGLVWRKVPNVSVVPAILLLKNSSPLTVTAKFLAVVRRIVGVRMYQLCTKVVRQPKKNVSVHLIPLFVFKLIMKFDFQG